MAMHPDVSRPREFTAAVLKTMRELRAHMSAEEYPPFVRDVATFLHATGTQRAGFITAAAAQEAALRLARAQLEEGLRRIGELEPAAASGDVRA